MAATFTGGVSWGTASTQTLTGALMATWISGTQIRDIATAEMASGSFPVYFGTSAPGSPPTGMVWRDTAKHITRRYDGSVFQPWFEGYVFANPGVTLPLGTILVAAANTAIAVERCNTAFWAGALGVCAEHLGQNLSGVVRFNGVGALLVTGTCTRGDVLTPHAVGAGVGGAAISYPASGGGGYSRTEAKHGTEIGIALWNNDGVAGTVTCLILK